jgi:alpha-D-ribose 1-methylphosphonate 5-triphosphate diphosphatase
MDRQILTNAVLVLPDSTKPGSLIIEDGVISEVIPGQIFSEGIDLGGQFLSPGLIDIHTDYLEKELTPRPDTHFPIELAFHLMDLRAIGCGVTTILGAARVSGDPVGALGSWHGDGVEMARQYARLRKTALARHYVHVRWDPNFEPCENAIQGLLELKEVIGNIVYNESIPGERQYRNTYEDQVRRHAISKGQSFEETLAWYEERARRARMVNNRAKVQAAFGAEIPLGSHDDTNVEHVVEAGQYGCSLAEMPVTMEAAVKAKELGMMVCMGAPNYYRGQSHCGNLSCRDAMTHGLVDILCSDYHFPSMLGSAVLMIEGGMAPHDALRLMTLNPARHLRKDDRLGSLEAGKTADLISFSSERGYGLVHRVWVDGLLKFDMSSALAGTGASS